MGSILLLHQLPPPFLTPFSIRFSLPEYLVLLGLYHLDAALQKFSVDFYRGLLMADFVDKFPKKVFPYFLDTTIPPPGLAFLRSFRLLGIFRRLLKILMWISVTLSWAAFQKTRFPVLVNGSNNRVIPFFLNFPQSFCNPFQ